ncbi:Uncharacterised protein r2_g895 [Pycnogonum litorale]
MVSHEMFAIHFIILWNFEIESHRVIENHGISCSERCRNPGRGQGEMDYFMSRGWEGLDSRLQDAITEIERKSFSLIKAKILTRQEPLREAKLQEQFDNGKLSNEPVEDYRRRVRNLV